jgi:hypothetical protein
MVRYFRKHSLTQFELNERNSVHIELDHENHFFFGASMGEGLVTARLRGKPSGPSRQHHAIGCRLGRQHCNLFSYWWESNVSQIFPNADNFKSHRYAYGNNIYYSKETKIFRNLIIHHQNETQRNTSHYKKRKKDLMT